MFGNEAVESVIDRNPAGWPEAFPFADGKSGSVSSITAYVDSHSRATTLIAGLYSDENGQPGSLLASGSLTHPKAASWNRVQVNSATVAAGREYWIAVLGLGGPLYFRDLDGASCTSQNALQTQLGSLASTWTSGPSWSTCRISAYARGSLAPSATPAPPAAILPPVNVLPPTISGTLVDGQTLTASNGTWLDSPASFTYQWQDCDSSGANCSNIAAATGSSYTLADRDVGHTVRVVVTGSNSAGSASTTSSQTTAVAPPPPPGNSAQPTVSGSAAQGQTLSTTNGSWTNNPQSYSYAWQDCNSSGASCGKISGATSNSYKLGSGDVGHTIRAVVTATNAEGSGSATSAPTAIVTAPPAPTNTALPQISGTTIQGDALTASKGSWTGSPTSYAYAWQDCNSSGASCSAIGGAGSSAYTLQPSDGGHTIRVMVTASNSGGSGQATSSSVGPVTAASPPSAPPRNTSSPTIIGTPQQGDTLTANDGTWSGDTPMTFSCAWSDGTKGCSDTLGASDVGQDVSVTVTATNDAGSASAMSPSIGPVTASSSGQCPESTPNTPGGPDPWGGCFPGPGNTGVPSNVTPVDVSSGKILPGNSAIPADNQGWSINDGQIYLDTSNAMVDGVKDMNGVYVPDGEGGTIKNSYIGDVDDNSNSGNLMVQSDTIDGGGNASFSPVNAPGGGGNSTVEVESIDAYDGKDGVHCLGTCTVTDSWLHDNVSNNTRSHQQGIYLNGGTNDVFTHNSIGCISATGCTADVAIMNAGPDVNIAVSKNLLLASPSSLNGEQTGYCVMPGPNAEGSWPKISGISWTNNVFEKGSGQCALNGPVYGWYPSLCSPDACTWTGNTWDNGQPMDESDN